MLKDEPSPNRYFLKPNDVLSIRRSLMSCDRVILVGPWVNGHTSVMNILSSQLRPYYHTLKIIPCYNLENVLELEYIVHQIQGNTLLCLDNYFDIGSEQLNDSLKKLMKKHYKGLHVILTTNSRSNLKKIEPVCPILDIQAFMEREFVQVQTENRFEYRSPLLYTESDRKKIITPEEKKLITDIQVIERSMLSLIRNNPQDMHGLTARQFEEFVAELYRAQGFEVALMKATRDGGKDFVISNRSVLGDQLIYGQCKKNSTHRPVGLAVIKELYATVVSDRATAGIVVTSSSFSKDAVRYAGQMPHQMGLVDFEKLKVMIHTVSH